jgi:hypothetical protein
MNSVRVIDFIKSSASSDPSKLVGLKRPKAREKGDRARCDELWRHQYAHLALRRNRAIAKVAMARKLAVRLFWMWRRGWDYQQLKKFGSPADGAYGESRTP